MNKTDIQKFQNYIFQWYSHHGRFSLPWRQTNEPYEILVSEIMLQQTQVERVIPKYQDFLKKYPTSQSLAHATLADVLQMWQGLGYNRRAQYLQETCRIVSMEKNGVFPKNYDALTQLPGIGPYTAGAICAFAYNQEVVLIETNIRTVFLYHFFPTQKEVKDTTILPLIEDTIPQSKPAEWYAALMDYGSHLKKVMPNPSRRSRHHVKQSRFEGSSRQVRGSIIRELTKGELSLVDLESTIEGDPAHFPTALEGLIKDKLVEKKNNKLYLRQ